MSMGVHHPYPLDLCAYDEDPSQLIIRPGWDAPHVRCSPRMFSAWPCLLRQVGTVLGSPYDCVVARLAYANPGSRQSIRRGMAFRRIRVCSVVAFGASPLSESSSSRFSDARVSAEELAVCVIFWSPTFSSVGGHSDSAIFRIPSLKASAIPLMTGMRASMPI